MNHLPKIIIIEQVKPILTDNGGLGELHPREIALLKKIREKYRYGVVEVQTYDGLPKQILKTIERENLD